MGYERTYGLDGHTRYIFTDEPEPTEEVRELTKAEIKAQKLASQLAKMPLLMKLLSVV